MPRVLGSDLETSGVLRSAASREGDREGIEKKGEGRGRAGPPVPGLKGCRGLLGP